MVRPCVVEKGQHGLHRIVVNWPLVARYAIDALDLCCPWQEKKVRYKYQGPLITRQVLDQIRIRDVQPPKSCEAFKCG